jgi:hypothetical protein
VEQQLVARPVPAQQLVPAEQVAACLLGGSRVGQQPDADVTTIVHVLRRLYCSFDFVDVGVDLVTHARLLWFDDWT